jgi:hypothetical protein
VSHTGDNPKLRPRRPQARDGKQKNERNKKCPRNDRSGDKTEREVQQGMVDTHGLQVWAFFTGVEGWAWAWAEEAGLQQGLQGA